jgi:hypothetical protein
MPSGGSGSRVPTGKYSSEIYGFIQLFQQAAGSIYGLIILEVAWLAGVRLLAGIAGPTAKTTGLRLPFGYRVTVLNLALWGLLAVGIAWAIAVHGRRAIPWARGLASGILTILAVPAAAALAVLNLPLFPALYCHKYRPKHQEVQSCAEDCRKGSIRIQEWLKLPKQRRDEPAMSLHHEKTGEKFQFG